MPTALVIGAGPAGVAAALALRKIGYDVVVYEAHDRPGRTAGSYLTVASNGLSALRAVGAAAAVIDRSFPTPDTILWSGTGKRLARVSNGVLPDGTATRTIRRADLAAALTSALDVPVTYGRRLTALDLTDDGGGVVTAGFADGGEARGDLLVGADGVHSAVRGLLDPAAPHARHVGLLNFGGYTAAGAGVPDVAPGCWNLVFGRRAFFGYCRDDVGGIVWFANVPSPRERPPAELNAWTSAEWRHHLVGLAVADRTPVAALIEAGDLRYGPGNTYDLPSTPIWRRGHAVLIGDGAHATSPSSGQGASMAFEDAVVLAQCLRDVPGVPDALAAYERLRRARVERVTAHAARISNAKAAGPVARTLRDLLLPLVLRAAERGRSESWMHEHEIDWHAAVH
ncbi:NAD(P)-binding protein [Nonomuraea sp. NN258]|uniref:FAD-dependent monooxygenase n=1 Tax=Nonomuraea antri TaxID=2730852 RepID=UPI00156825B3|nr:FAD-dependent monooxygenase [Nonomuraea antri]NRQ37334.1 NAD(P)-binding protein [Nonomuraea antri]